MKPINLNKIILTSTLLALGACGGSGDGGSNNDTGSLTLNVTDAPVDGATAVVVEFSGVTLKHADGEDIEFLFDDPTTPDPEVKSIDLLALQGTLSQPLLEAVETPEGEYTQIRLHVNAEFDSTQDSYIDLSDGSREELRVPSGTLKLNSPFTVDAGTADAVYTIDFDLRKAVVNPVGQPGHFLRPSLRLVQNLNVRSISGTVDADLLTTPPATDCSSGNAVYAYSGADATVDDVGSANEPVASALVALDDTSGEFVYELGFMNAGEYTLAFTCQADQDFAADDADDPDGNADDDILFSDSINVDVTLGSLDDANFIAP
jgi:hypothetical protein